MNKLFFDIRLSNTRLAMAIMCLTLSSSVMSMDKDELNLDDTFELNRDNDETLTLASLPILSERPSLLSQSSSMSLPALSTSLVHPEETMPHTCNLECDLRFATYDELAKHKISHQLVTTSSSSSLSVMQQSLQDNSNNSKKRNLEKGDEYPTGPKRSKSKKPELGAVNMWFNYNTANKPKPTQHPTRTRKRFTCDHPGCSYSATRQSGLDTHQFTHYLPDRCNHIECGLTFLNPSALADHQRACRKPVATSSSSSSSSSVLTSEASSTKPASE